MLRKFTLHIGQELLILFVFSFKMRTQYCTSGVITVRISAYAQKNMAASALSLMMVIRPWLILLVIHAGPQRVCHQRHHPGARVPDVGRGVYLSDQ